MSVPTFVPCFMRSTVPVSVVCVDVMGEGQLWSGLNWITSSMLKSCCLDEPGWFWEGIGEGGGLSHGWN